MAKGGKAAGKKAALKESSVDESKKKKLPKEPKAMPKGNDKLAEMNMKMPFGKMKPKEKKKSKKKET